MVIAETRKNSGVPVRYLLVMWLLLLGGVAYLDRTNISIAGIQIGREFGIANTHLGWVFSAFLIGYAGFQVPGGLLARRFGPRRVLLFGVLWWGVFTTLTAMAPTHMRGAVFVLVAVRFALGAGEAVLYPAINQFVERWFPIVERGKANGFIFAGVGLGAGLTPPLVTEIILRYGWRAPFGISAVIGIAAGAVWYLIATDTPEEHAWVSVAELEKIQAGRGVAGEVVASEWGKVFASREAWALTGSYFAFCYATWIFFGWFYIYLVQVRGLDLRTSSVYSIFPYIALTVGCIVGGVVGDWLSRRYSRRVGRCWMAATAMVVTAVLLVVGSRAENALAATVILASSVGVLYLAQNCFWSLTADIAGRRAGVVSGVMNMGGQIGGAVAASLTPLLAARLGWHAAFLAAAVLLMLGAGAWMVVDPDRRLAE